MASVIANEPSSALAQNLQPPLALSVSIPDATAFIAPTSSAPPDPFAIGANDYVGRSVGTWMLYPTIYSGVTMNDNLFLTPSNRVGDVATNYVPTFVAVRSDGIHNTLVYGTINVNDYLHHSVADTANGRLGFQHRWEALRDLIFNIDADVWKQTDVMNSGLGFNQPFVPVQSQLYNAHASFIKSFDRIYFTLGGRLSNTSYSNSTFSGGGVLYQSYRNFVEPLLNSRIGYKISNIIYAFADTTINWQNDYNSRLASSNGYRTTAGLGSDRLNLFSGEIFAGYQEQFFRLQSIGAVGDGVVGGNITWHPTELLSVSTSLDETVNTESFISTINPTTSAFRMTTADLSVVYTLPGRWSIAGHVDFSKSNFTNSDRIDKHVSAGSTVSYHISKNLVATLNYILIYQSSNVSDASFSNNRATLGVTYRY